MKSTMIRSLVAAVCAFGALMASAVPTSIAYQGILRDANGAAISGDLNKTIEFRLYKSASSDEQALWGHTVAVLLDSTGLFNVALSDDIGSSITENVQYTSLSDAIKAARGSSLYIGLTVVGSSGEISPRQQILSVPYASYAQDVDTASGDFSVEGTAKMANLTVNGTATFAGSVDFRNPVTMGNTKISGGLTVDNTGSISGYGTIPVGGIIMWSGSKGSVPDGWKLCDGTDGTPDLRNRFILGAESVNSTGATGGQSSVTLFIENIPSHRHEYLGDDQLEGIDTETTSVARRLSGYDATSKLSGSPKAYRTSATGGGKSFDIMPPYYKLAFIMRVK